MTRLLITGARQKLGLTNRPEWHLYEEAQVVELDPDSGSACVRLRYRSAPELCPAEDPSHVFKAGSIDGDRLLLCTQTEVLRVHPETMEIERRYSLPYLNDVHHIARVRGRLHAVSTGLDAVVSFDDDGELCAIENVLGEAPWERFDPDTDYRRVPTTKPHAAHPNYIFETPHGRWVTRFEQKDALCLDDPRRRIELPNGKPHDGWFDGESAWFTTVTGFVIRTDPESCKVTDVVDLNEIDGSGAPLGWCRGFALVDGVAFVGFSRLRHTAIRRNVSWARHGFRRKGSHAKRPTRIVAYDLPRRRQLHEWVLQDTQGQDAVFSILPL